MNKQKSLKFDKPRNFKLNLHLSRDSFQGAKKSFFNLLHIEATKTQKNNFPSNYIQTTKYTFLNFIPKSIMAQFRRYANIYFLMIAILQCFPEISPLHPFTAIAPLVFVLFLSMLRDGFEDYRRYKSDKETNSYECLTLRDGKPTTIKWMDVVIGDVILVKNEEILAADLIVLSSSEDGGMCFLETSSLDGEKNLKTKIAQKLTCESVAKSMNLSGMHDWEFFAGKPTANIYHFEGHINVIDDGKIKEKIILNEKQLLLRGAKLKNTKWIVGIATYTGLDSRIMKNSSQGKVKQSNIEKRTNKFIIGILIFQMICSLYGSLQYYYNSQKSPHAYAYYRNEKFSLGLETFMIFLTYFLLNNTMMPISLIVSLEVVKISQSYFMNNDEDMYVAESNKYCKVMTSSINEELGQVDYVFTDKTGTLTCNKMEFKLLVVGDTLFGSKYLHQDDQNSLQKDINDFEDKSPDNKISKMKSKRRVSIVDRKSNVIFNFSDKKLSNILKKIGETTRIKSTCQFFNGNDHIQSLNTTSPEDNFFEEFTAVHFHDKQTGELLYQIPTLMQIVLETFLIMSTCHECIVERDSNNYVHYMGPSSDEIAIVDASRHLGFKFIGASKSSVTVEVFENRRHMELLHVFPFDSNRKRMSIIVRDHGVIKLYMKGADSNVKALLDPNIKQVFKRSVEEYIDQMSKKGFRSLALAMKVISENEWMEYKLKFERLIGKGDELEAENNKIADEIEKDLLLIGAIGVEDKLQDRVPETIKDLIKAKIKVWMITGDKMETAENIGISCNLIQPNMTVIRVSSERITKERNLRMVFDESWEIYQILAQEKGKKALLIDGTCLGAILINDELWKKFLEMSHHCDSVVCCRMTPGQKAEVVRQIKTKFNKITVAIGDGANDVSMIQEANIGIGIWGQEGVRAVQASDYAVGEFRCLWKLLFVHGRWSYIRISKMILYFFYKNMALTFPQTLYSLFTLCSGQTIFDDWYISCYNMIFTAVPLVVRAVFDYDVYYKFLNSQKTSTIQRSKIMPYFSNKKVEELNERPIIKKNYPLLYEIGQKNQIFRDGTFILWILQGLIHSTYIFFVNYFVFISKSVNEDGLTADIWLISISIFTSLILVVDTKLIIETHRWTKFLIISLIISSIGIYFLFIFVMDMLPKLQLYSTAKILLTSSQFYLSSLLCIGFLVVFDLIRIVLQKEFTSSLSDQFQYLIKNKKDHDIKYFKEMEKLRKKGKKNSATTGRIGNKTIAYKPPD